jgi:serine/threonine protein kinase
LEKSAFNPKQADIWSLGALLYSVCTGHTPLGTIRGDIIENASKEIRFPDAKLIALTKELKGLTKGMLAYKPETRLVGFLELQIYSLYFHTYPCTYVYTLPIFSK